MYNGPLRVYLEGPGGAGNPRYPFLVSQGRNILGLLESRADIVDLLSLVGARNFADGTSVRALWTPDVKKLIVSIPPGVGKGEEGTEEEGEIEIIEREWVEQNRDFLEGETNGGLRSDRIARITWQTPDETLVRFNLEEADDPEADPEGGPTPDVEWDENSRDEELDTEFGDRIERIVFDVPSFLDPVAPIPSIKVALTYFRTEQRETDAPFSALPAGTVEWTEATRQVALVLVDGSTTEIERIMTLTMERLVVRPDTDSTRIFRVIFRYEEGTENFEFPSNVEVLELPEEFQDEE